MMGFLTLAISLLGGWLGKKAGKSTKVGGNRPMQKILAPLAAVATAAATAVITGEADSSRVLAEAAVQGGGSAILVHTVAKNIIQLIKS